jgi:hypothetical protein
MLTNIIRVLQGTEEKLATLLTDFAPNYTRELLASHGLAKIEIDHIRRTFQVEPPIVPIHSGRTARAVLSSESPLPESRLKVVRVQRPTRPTDETEPIRPPAPNCDPWTGPEVVAALSVVGAAILALVSCLAAIFKS